MGQRQAVNRSVPSLLVSLVVSFMVAGGVSALILGLIPATRHASFRIACASDSSCVSGVLLLAVPGFSLALATLIGASIWAVISVKRQKRGAE